MASKKFHYILLLLPFQLMLFLFGWFWREPLLAYVSSSKALLMWPFPKTSCTGMLLAVLFRWLRTMLLLLNSFLAPRVCMCDLRLSAITELTRTSNAFIVSRLIVRRRLNTGVPKRLEIYKLNLFISSFYFFPTIGPVSTYAYASKHLTGVINRIWLSNHCFCMNYFALFSKHLAVAYLVCFKGFSHD